MANTGLNKLPTELLLHIVDYIKSSPPSEARRRHEPRLDLFESSDQPLKNLSSTSKSWRKLLGPIVFSHVRIRLDINPRPHWAACPACGDLAEQHLSENDPALEQVERYHVDLARTYRIRLASIAEDESLALLMHIPGKSDDVFGPFRHFDPADVRDAEKSSIEWATRFYHSLEDFCTFVRTSRLGPHIRSVTVVSDHTVRGPHAHFPVQETLKLDWRYAASANFWRHLYSVISPERIVILAPPVELLCLINCTIAENGHILRLPRTAPPDTWNILELRSWPRRLNSQFNRWASSLEDLWYLPDGRNYRLNAPPATAQASLLFLQPWKDLHVNEGSYLWMFGSVDFFEGGSSWLSANAYSIMHGIDLERGGKERRRLSKSLKTLTYTSMFHCPNLLRWAQRVAALNIQLAPGPESTILDNKERVGRAELLDCWSEVREAYRRNSIPIRLNANIASRIDQEPESWLSPSQKLPRLKRFVCRDYQVHGLREDLDEIFRDRDPKWEERERGVFVRETP